MPSSRWVTLASLSRWMTSIGSSMVRMCTARVSLIASTIAASVVVLPDPVGPVTSTRPRGSSASWRITSGSPSSASDIGLVADQPHHAADRAAGAEGVDPEPADARHRQGVVGLVGRLELRLDVGAASSRGPALSAPVGGQRVDLERHQGAGDPDLAADRRP